MDSKHTPPIIFFDGVCHLCNGFVDFLIQKDLQKNLRFASLQGATALQELGPEFREDLTSVLAKTPTQVLRRSDAVIYAMAALGGAYISLNLLKIIPRPLRDFAYNYVAKNRYSWFGKRDICRLPLLSEKDQLLP